VRSGEAGPGDDPMLCVLGELVVDMLPLPTSDAGPEGTAPRFVARPGGNALNAAVAAGRLGTPVRLLARLGTSVRRSPTVRSGPASATPRPSSASGSSGS
jgi:hypothetical protein